MNDTCTMLMEVPDVAQTLQGMAKEVAHSGNLSHMQSEDIDLEKGT